MNRSKKIEVNSTSILDLKAELVRKQQEFNRRKLQPRNEKPIQSEDKKKFLWNKQNIGVAARDRKDKESSKERQKDDFAEEEDQALRKSRAALEAKTKLYEQMSKKIADDESSELYLVDFQRKAINLRNEEKMKEKESKEEESDDEEVSVLPPSPETPDEEWVDYVDALGRSRKCLKKDLRQMEQMDRQLREKPDEPRESEPDAEEVKWNKGMDLLSNDMRDEIERQEWEDEAIDGIEKSEPTGPVHYQKVKDQEIRNHGVGYYAFSVDEEERQKQLDMLQNLRKQTETQKSNREKLKEKRKTMLQARLAKVKERKNITIPTDEEEEEEEELTAEVVVKDDEQVNEEKPVITVEKEKLKTVRAWDRGKIGVRNESFQKPPPPKRTMTGEDWIRKQREERKEEFAPPQFYFEDQPRNKKRNYRQTNTTTKTEVNPTTQQEEITTQQTQSNPDENLEKHISDMLKNIGNKVCQMPE